VLIGIAGGSGSGKTLVAETLIRELGSDRVVVLRQDSYYRNITEVRRDLDGVPNFDHPDALDLALLESHVLALLHGHPIQQPLYDFTVHRRTGETTVVGPHHVIVLEGTLVLYVPGLRSLMDIKVYIETDPDVRLVRRLRRDVAERGRTVDSVLTQYEHTVRPMHLTFVEQSKRYADVIIPEGGHNLVAIDLLQTKIRSLLDVRAAEDAAEVEAARQTTLPLNAHREDLIHVGGGTARPAGARMD
jgi:uridine kinase